MKNDPNSAVSMPSLRNLQLLEVLGREGRAMTSAELNAVLELPKPTLHRLIGSLEEQGFLLKDIDGRSYLPGPRYQAMAMGAVRASFTCLPAREVLVAMNRRIGETCNLSIPDGDAMLYIDRVETHWPLRIALLHIGSKVPFHATSAGKVGLSMPAPKILDGYLAASEKVSYTRNTITDPDRLREEVALVRERGYATDREEFVDGMIALAVPVLDGGRRFRATLSFHAPIQRLPFDRVLMHLDTLHDAAAKLGALL